MARRPRLAVAAATAAVLALLVEVYRLDATQFLALLVVTPLEFVAFKRWSFQLGRAARIERPVR